jgi:hypothetical protein
MQLQGHQPDMNTDTQNNVTAELNTITKDKFPSFWNLYKHCNRRTESKRDYFEGVVNQDIFLHITASITCQFHYFLATLCESERK